MQANRPAHQLRRQDIALKKLPKGENRGDDADGHPIPPELEQRQPDGQGTAHQRADIGDECDRPGDGPHHQTELQACQHQCYGIEGAQDQADTDLPAHEAGQHRVDLVRDPAHGGGMVARQQAVDARHHLVPVQQQVKGDHRHDDDEDHHRNQVKRRCDNAVHQLAAARTDRLADLGQGLAGCAGAVAQLWKAVQQKGLQLPGDFRHGRDQRTQLADQCRDHRKHQSHHHQHRQQRDHGRCRNPAQTQPLQPVRHRIKEIGNGPADDEGQDHIAQQVQQGEEPDRRDAPVFQLVPNR